MKNILMILAILLIASGCQIKPQDTDKDVTTTTQAEECFEGATNC